jgi:L-amino acid N-acyltransferase
MQSMEKRVQIRDAGLLDLGAITAIYNEVLTSSTAIYSDQLTTLEERTAWWKARREQGYPVLVATDGSHVAGFGTFGDFRSWPGYRFTVEGTIHIHSSSRSQGVGTALLQELIRRARALGKHTMLAGVDSENTASLRFLERSGFEHVGYIPEAGYKFDRFLDLVLLQYWITPPSKDHRSPQAWTRRAATERNNDILPEAPEAKHS